MRGSAPKAGEVGNNLRRFVVPAQCSDPAEACAPCIASNRSETAADDGWINRSQDSAMSCHVRFSDSLRVKRAMRSHSAAFARYSSFLLMGLLGAAWGRFPNPFVFCHINRDMGSLFRHAGAIFPLCGRCLPQGL